MLGGLDDGFRGASGRRIEVKGTVNRRLVRLGLSRLAHVQRTAVSAAEAGGNAALAGEDAADGLYELVSQNGNKQTAVDALLVVMEHRTQAKFAFETAEDGFRIGEGGIGAPQLVFAPLGFVAVQAVHNRMGEACAGDRLSCPSQGDGFFPGGVGLQFDCIVLPDAVEFLLEPANALPKFVEALFGARLGEALGDRIQCFFETRTKALDHGILFLLPGR